MENRNITARRRAAIEFGLDNLEKGDWTETGVLSWF